MVTDVGTPSHCGRSVIWSRCSRVGHGARGVCTNAYLDDQAVFLRGRRWKPPESTNDPKISGRNA